MGSGGQGGGSLLRGPLRLRTAHCFSVTTTCRLRCAMPHGACTINAASCLAARERFLRYSLRCGAGRSARRAPSFSLLIHMSCMVWAAPLWWACLSCR
eukprot:4314046-Prymnesium_polylepis.1